MFCISIVIPVYNNAQRLQELVSRLFLMADANQYVLEAIITDDGSTIETWNMLRHIKGQYPSRSITLLRLGQNHGQHYATLCGLLAANNDILVTMDSDLQHQPEDIPLLVQEITTKQRDLVYGIASSGHPWHYQLSSFAFRQLTRTWRRPVYNGSGFRCFKKSLLEKLTPHTNMRFFFLDAIFPNLTHNIVSIPTRHLPRENVKTHYNTLKRTHLFLKIAVFHASKTQLITTLFAGIILLFSSHIFFQSSNNYLSLAIFMKSLFLTAISLSGLINKKNKIFSKKEISNIIEKIS